MEQLDQQPLRWTEIGDEPIESIVEGPPFAVNSRAFATTLAAISHTYKNIDEKKNKNHTEKGLERKKKKILNGEKLAAREEAVGPWEPVLAPVDPTIELYEYAQPVDISDLKFDKYTVPADAEMTAANFVAPPFTRTLRLNYVATSAIKRMFSVTAAQLLSTISTGIGESVVSPSFDSLVLKYSHIEQVTDGGFLRFYQYHPSGDHRRLVPKISRYTNAAQGISYTFGDELFRIEFSGLVQLTLRVDMTNSNCVTKPSFVLTNAKPGVVYRLPLDNVSEKKARNFFHQIVK